MSLLSNKFTCGFAASWGMAYVYDFLYRYEYISKEVYDDAMEIINNIKVEIIEGNRKHLWEYNFVHE